MPHQGILHVTCEMEVGQNPIATESTHMNKIVY